MTEQRPPFRRRRAMPDARLVVGIALVIASVVGVVVLVNTTDTRTTVYVAASTFVPGDRIFPDGLLARRVALDDATGLYLATGDVPDGGLVATAIVRGGELIPRAAVGSAAGTESTSIVLHLTGEVSESVIAGALVDVWSSSTDAGGVGSDESEAQLGAFGAPVVLCPDAVVVRVLEPDGIVSASDGRSVEVLVPRSRIARLLQAIADDDALAVVPAGIPLATR